MVTSTNIVILHDCDEGWHEERYTAAKDNIPACMYIPLKQTAIPWNPGEAYLVAGSRWRSLSACSRTYPSRCCAECGRCAGHGTSSLPGQPSTTSATSTGRAITSSSEGKIGTDIEALLRRVSPQHSVSSTSAQSDGTASPQPSFLGFVVAAAKLKRA